MAVIRARCRALRELPARVRVGALGRPFQRDLHKRVLRDALSLLKEPPRPGEIIERVYPEYGPE